MKAADIIQVCKLVHKRKQLSRDLAAVEGILREKARKEFRKSTRVKRLVFAVVKNGSRYAVNMQKLNAGDVSDPPDNLVAWLEYKRTYSAARHVPASHGIARTRTWAKGLK